MQPLAITIAEACSAAGISRSSIYEAIRRGELTAVKFGAKTLIRVDDLRAWLDSLPPIGSGPRRNGAAA